MTSEWKTTLSLAWPIILGLLLQMGLTFSDNLMVGRLGTSQLGGLGLAASFYSIFFASSMGILGMLGPLISKAHAQNNPKQITAHLRDGLQVALCFGALGFLVLSQAPSILSGMGQNPENIAHAVPYLKIIVWAIPLDLMFSALRQLNEGCGYSRPSFYFALLALILNLPVNYLLIFGLNWGVLQWSGMGVEGAAIATLIVCGLRLIGMIYFISIHSDLKNYWVVKQLLSIDTQSLIRLLRLGLPVSGTYIAEMGLFAMTTMLAGLLSTQGLAAHQLTLNLASVIFMVPLGLSIAVSIRVSQGLGLHNKNKIQHTVNTSLLLALCFSLISMCLFIFGGQFLARIYTKDPELIAAATALLMIAGLFQVGDCLQAVGNGILKGLHDTLVPVFYSLVIYLGLGLGSAWFLAFKLEWGVPGIWWALLLSVCVASIAHRLRYQIVMRRLLKL